MSKGIIYILTNEAMPGLCKIGLTTRTDLQTRMDELYTTGVPLQFDCMYACEVENCEAVEKAFHHAFSQDRINPRREFFKIDSAYKAIDILKAFAVKEVTLDVKKDLDSSTTTEERQAAVAFKKRRPTFNFQEMGIPVGSRLDFIHIPGVYCTVVDGRHVMYEGETFYLTTLEKKLLNIEYAPSYPCWMYGEKQFLEMYNETYPIEND